MIKIIENGKIVSNETFITDRPIEVEVLNAEKKYKIAKETSVMQVLNAGQSPNEGCLFCNHKFQAGDHILEHYRLNHNLWIHTKLIELAEIEQSKDNKMKFTFY